MLLQVIGTFITANQSCRFYPSGSSAPLEKLHHLVETQTVQKSAQLL
jgi:hypothetical protein